MNTRRFSTTLLGILVLTLGGCTYGDIQERTIIKSVLNKAESRILAVALHYQKFRPPTGISQFPDGGANKMLAQAAIFLIADVDGRTVRELARIEAPKELRTAFDVHIHGWQGERFVVTLSGCPGDECYGNLQRFQQMAIAPSGQIEHLERLPSGLSQPSGRLAREVGERVYTRVSFVHNTIRVCTEEADGFRAVFTLDSAGVLQPVHD
jgi:hypothetical protein